MNEELDSEVQEYVANQHAKFRDLVSFWAADKTISNAEFGQMVSKLDWDFGMIRMEWLAKRKLAERQRSPEEILDSGEVFRG